MNSNIACRRIVLAGAGALILFACAAPSFAQSVRPIEGVWVVSITQRDCETSAANGYQARTVLTFHQGGTLLEASPWFGPLDQAGIRDGISDPQGSWTHHGGPNYVTRTVGMNRIDGRDPLRRDFGGWEVGQQTITMTDANTFTSTGQIVFYDINRRPYRVECTSRLGERFR